jgi:hypothetical protein
MMKVFIVLGCALILSLSETPARCKDLTSQAPIVCGSEKAQEPPGCVSRLKGLMERRGDTLRLNIEIGAPKVYKSNEKACINKEVEKCIVSNLIRFYPQIQSFLVSVSQYECGHYELVSRRIGSVLEISTVPELAPSGSYLISVDQNEACDRNYELAIWSTKTDPPSLELKYKAPKGQYEYWTVAGWSGDDRIKLKVSVNGDQGSYDQDAAAVRSAAGWKLVRGDRVDRPR